VKWNIQVHWADRMRVVLHPPGKNATIVLGPSEGGLGGMVQTDLLPTDTMPIRPEQRVFWLMYLLSSPRVGSLPPTETVFKEYSTAF